VLIVVQRRKILTALTRARLLEVAGRFEVAGLSGKSKEQVVGAITGKRSIPTRQLLETLKRAELKAVCRAVGLEDGGREKSLLVARLLGEMEVNKKPAARASGKAATKKTPARHTAGHRSCS